MIKAQTVDESTSQRNRDNKNTRIFISETHCTVQWVRVENEQLQLFILDQIRVSKRLARHQTSFSKHCMPPKAFSSRRRKPLNSIHIFVMRKSWRDSSVYNWYLIKFGEVTDKSETRQKGHIPCRCHWSSVRANEWDDTKIAKYDSMEWITWALYCCCCFVNVENCMTVERELDVLKWSGDFNALLRHSLVNSLSIVTVECIYGFCFRLQKLPESFSVGKDRFNRHNISRRPILRASW